MIPFRATYKPKRYDDDGRFLGFDDEKAEKVRIVKVFYNRIVAYISSTGELDVAPMECFSDCEG